MAVFGMLKDAGEGLVEWWRQEKISGTIMPIFLILNVVILWEAKDWTMSQLLANAFMLILMIWSIWQFRIKAIADNSETKRLAKEKDVEIREIEERYKLEHERLKLDREKFEHRRDLELFAKNIVDVEHRKKMILMDERGEFVEEQIEQKVNHVIFLTSNFEMTESMRAVIDTHKEEIRTLRAYKRDLPKKLELRYKEMMKLNPPTISSTGEIVQKELEAVMKQVEGNLEIKGTMKDIQKE